VLSRVTEKRIAVVLIVIGVIVLLSVSGGEDLAQAQGAPVSFWFILIRIAFGLLGISLGAIVLGGGSDE
jgi:hypothetical protein